MNFKELKEEIRDLAFEENASMQEYESIVIHAINRATRIISSTVSPIINSVQIQHEKSGQTLVKYDMRELTAVNGKSDFLSFTGEVTKSDGKSYEPHTSHQTEIGRYLLLPENADGIYTVYYEKQPTKITKDTPDTFEMELDQELHILLPLLCAYYVWLDDDDRKAAMYRNDYEDVKAQIMGRKAGVVSQSSISTTFGGM